MVTRVKAHADDTVPFVVFSAPPSGSEDYPTEVYDLTCTRSDRAHAMYKLHLLLKVEFTTRAGDTGLHRITTANHRTLSARSFFALVVDLAGDGRRWRQKLLVRVTVDDRRQQVQTR
jgi:hypothetical protein